MPLKLKVLFLVYLAISIGAGIAGYIREVQNSNAVVKVTPDQYTDGTLEIGPDTQSLEVDPDIPEIQFEVDPEDYDSIPIDKPGSVLIIEKHLDKIVIERNDGSIIEIPVSRLLDWIEKSALCDERR